jgi:hypothetical protein
MSVTGKLAVRIGSANGGLFARPLNVWTRAIDQARKNGAETARFLNVLGRRTLQHGLILPFTHRAASNSGTFSHPRQARQVNLPAVSGNAWRTLRAAGHAANAARSELARDQGFPALIEERPHLRYPRTASVSNHPAGVIDSESGDQNRDSRRRAASLTPLRLAPPRIRRWDAEDAIRHTRHQFAYLMAQPDRVASRKIGPFTRAVDSIGAVSRAIKPETAVSGKARGTNMRRIEHTGIATTPNEQKHRLANEPAHAWLAPLWASFASPWPGRGRFGRALAFNEAGFALSRPLAFTSHAAGYFHSSLNAPELLPSLPFRTRSSANNQAISHAANVVVNSSPTVVIQNGNTAQIENAVLDALRTHRAELYEELRQEARRHLRSDF